MQIQSGGMNAGIKINTGEKIIIVIDATKKEVIRALGILLLVSEVLIFLRIILKLFGADPQSIFVKFIYIASGAFLLPFFGMFPQFQDPVPGQGAIDAVAMIGLLSYLILVPVSMMIIQIGTSILKIGKKVAETVERDNPIDDESELIHKVVN